MKKEPERYIGGHIPVSIYERIKKLAEANDRPMVWAIKKLINEGLEKNSETVG